MDEHKEEHYTDRSEFQTRLQQKQEEKSNRRDGMTLGIYGLVALILTALALYFGKLILLAFIFMALGIPTLHIVERRAKRKTWSVYVDDESTRKNA